MELVKGTKFDTIAEVGLVVTVAPKDYKYGNGSNFLAVAPDGVECQYVTAMVKGHPDFYDPTSR